jgi:hypothetical protein
VHPKDAYAKDLLLYNSHPIFATMAVTKRHLHGKKGIYALLFGIAAIPTDPKWPRESTYFFDI